VQPRPVAVLLSAFFSPERILAFSSSGDLAPLAVSPGSVALMEVQLVLVWDSLLFFQRSFFPFNLTFFKRAPDIVRFIGERLLCRLFVVGLDSSMGVRQSTRRFLLHPSARALKARYPPAFPFRLSVAIRAATSLEDFF